jgi:hypothetical protein
LTGILDKNFTGMAVHYSMFGVGGISMFSIHYFAAAGEALNPIADWLYMGLVFLLLLACGGLIILCDRLMEGGK